jgi:hypothetical protein
MGYAKLTFTTSTTSSQLLSDVHNVLTGNFTTASQLQNCVIGSSEIINTLGENWTSVVNASNEKALSSPCVNSAKTKYAILRSVTGTSNTALGSGALIAGTSGASGIIVNSASFVASGASVVATNPTYYNTSTTAALTNGARFGTNVELDTQLFLSWSSRHLLIYGGVQGASATTYTSIFEFPENNLTTYNNSAPVLTHKVSVVTTGLATSGAPAVDTSNLSSIVTSNQFLPSNTTPAVSGAFSISSVAGTLYASTYGSSTHVTSLNALSQSAGYLIPLWVSQPAAGIPILNCSALTNVFSCAPTVGNTGETVNVGGITYVLLVLGTAMYSGTKYSIVLVPRR